MRARYQRGTIVLEDVPVALDARSLPHLVWDPRIAQLRLPAFRWPELTRALEQRGFIPPRLELGRRDAPTGGWREVPLRPYQRSALLAWETSAHRGVVVLPTGSGKTQVALAAMARLNRPTLCVAPTRVLLHQWHDAIARVYRGDVGRLGDGQRDVQAVTVATFESAYRAMDRLGGRFDLLVVDEAHHFGSGLRDELLEMSVAPFRLGLTATPPLDELALTRVEERIGSTVFRMSVDELAGSWLAPYAMHTVEVTLTASERQAYEREMEAFRRVFAPFQRFSRSASWREFTHAASKTTEGRRALAGWRRARSILSFPVGKQLALGEILERHRSDRVLVFTADNPTAYAVSRAHLLMPITCDIKKAERDLALARFRRGELRALVSARVLNEGLDVPDADVAVIVGASLGAREHVQRIGRVLRPAPGKRALVYELVVRETSDAKRAAHRRALFAPRRASTGERATELRERKAP